MKNEKISRPNKDAIAFYTPVNVNLATYKMQLSISDMTLSGTSIIEWTHTGDRPLQTLQIKGDYTWLTLLSHEDYGIDKDETITVITLGNPLEHGETVVIHIGFARDFVASPLCAGDGSVLMPKGLDGRIWYPYLAWDIQVCGHYSVEVNEPAGYRICATGERNGDKYQQNYVRWFGLLLCKGLTYAEQPVGDVTIKAYYKHGNETAAQKLMDTSADAIAYYKELIGFYPQHSYSFLPYSDEWWGGGNLSTGIAFFHRMHEYNHAESDARPWIAAHEICHHYWGEYVLDGDDCGWLWIGLGMMMDAEYSVSRGLGDVGEKRAAQVIRYHQSGNDTTIWRSKEELRKAEQSDNDYNSIVRHSKSYCVMRMLRQTIGKEALFDIMRHILAQYAGRALRTMDFWRICEEKSGMRLDWLFTDCLHSNRLPGYEIVSIEYNSGGTAVTVKSRGDFKFPVYVEARLSGGSVMRRQFNRLMDTQTLFLDGIPKSASLSLNADGHLVSCADKASRAPKLPGGPWWTGGHFSSRRGYKRTK